MREENLILSHPYDFFRYQHLTSVPNTCFVLMPFDDK